MNKYEEKTLHTNKIFEGKIISLQVDEVELPDGNRSKREIVRHPGAVAVIAVTSDNKIIMVEQYRKPLERSLIEIPAGKLEKGEEPLSSAKRELEEETGLQSDEWSYITSFYTSPGFADELIYIYVAKNVYPVENSRPGDEDEFIDIYHATLDEAKEWKRQEKIRDAKTEYALVYAEAKGLI